MTRIYITIIIIIYFYTLPILKVFPDDVIYLNDNSKLTGKIKIITHDKIKLKIKYGKIDIINLNIKDIFLDEEITIEKQIQQKKYKEAINSYSRLISNSTNSSKIHIYSYKMALLYKKTKKHKKAIKVLQALINSQNFFILKHKAYFLLYDIYILKKEFSKAEDILNILEKNVALNNEISARIIFYKSIIEQNRDNEEKQIKYLSKIIEKYPKTTFKKPAQKTINKIILQKNVEKEFVKIPIEMEKIQNQRWRYSNIKLYDRIIKRCQFIIKNSTDIPIINKAYLFIMKAYKLQAEYTKYKMISTEYFKFCSINQPTEVSSIISKFALTAHEEKKYKDALWYFSILKDMKLFKYTMNYIIVYLDCVKNSGKYPLIIEDLEYIFLTKNNKSQIRTLIKDIEDSLFLEKKFYLLEKYYDKISLNKELCDLFPEIILKKFMIYLSQHKTKQCDQTLLKMNNKQYQHIKCFISKGKFK